MFIALTTEWRTRETRRQVELQAEREAEEHLRVQAYEHARALEAEGSRKHA